MLTLDISSSSVYVVDFEQFEQVDFVILERYEIKDFGDSQQLFIYYKENNRNIRKGCGICSKLTIKTTELRQNLRWRALQQ